MNILGLLFATCSFAAGTNSAEIRLIATTPAHAEWIYDLFPESPGIIVGTSEYTSPPSEGPRPAIVGNSARLSAEKILALHPTHILGPIPLGSQGSLSRLRSLKKISISLDTFSDLVRFLNALKEEFPEKREKISEYLTKLDQSLLPSSRLDGKKVALVFAWKPAWIAGPKSYLGEWFERQKSTVAGQGQWFSLTEEKLLSLHPDALIVLSEEPSFWAVDQGNALKGRFQKTFPNLEIQPWVCPGLFRLGPRIFKTMECLKENLGRSSS
jgi:ABC-type Fe3+-hydroxamate transport system substrate-binding protein